MNAVRTGACEPTAGIDSRDDRRSGSLARAMEQPPDHVAARALNAAGCASCVCQVHTRQPCSRAKASVSALMHKTWSVA